MLSLSPRTNTRYPVADPSDPARHRRPKSGRWRRVMATVAVLVLAGALNACSPEQDHIRDLVNAARADTSRAPLAEDGGLDDKATFVARSLAAAQALRHTQLADGVPGGWRKLGENVGYGSSIDSVEAAFLGSAPHRANILDSAFNRIGTGYATGNCPGASATCVYIVQEFGAY